MEFYPFFRKAFPYSPTPCQERLLRAVSAFLSSDDGDILVVNGYAGTGKTTAMAAVVAGLAALEIPSVLLAPTGRAAKVPAGQPRCCRSTRGIRLLPSTSVFIGKNRLARREWGRLRSRSTRRGARCLLWTRCRSLAFPTASGQGICWKTWWRSCGPGQTAGSS